VQRFDFCAHVQGKRRRERDAIAVDLGVIRAR